MSDRNVIFQKYSHSTRKRAEVAMHQHTNGQLNYVSKGTVRLKTTSSSWVIPQQRLVWIPPDESHSLKANALSDGWKVMIPRSFQKFLPKQVCVLQTSDLLVAAIKALPEAEHSISAKKKKLLTEIIQLELESAKRESFEIAIPKSKKLAEIAEFLLEHSDDQRTLDQWAISVGMSRQSLIRAFKSEVGSTFGAWKTELLLQKALEFLAEGLSVNETADRIGYSESSAFVAAFRKRFGLTPGKFFKSDN